MVDGRPPGIDEQPRGSVKAVQWLYPGIRSAAHAGLSHSTQCSLQHATAAKRRLRRTASLTPINNLAASAEKLLRRTLPTLSKPSYSAILTSYILASFLAY
jgi:hypothetical protein